MEIPFIDRSLYLKGLLITAKRDNRLTNQEKNIIRKIAEKLGFASDFYEDTMKSMLANKYISDEPLKFSDPKIAESFISDAFRLALSDGNVCDAERVWLKRTAQLNNLNELWVDDQLSILKSANKNLSYNDFALLSII